MRQPGFTPYHRSLYGVAEHFAGQPAAVGTWSDRDARGVTAAVAAVSEVLVVRVEAATSLG
jgi:hypothetical protein